MVRRSRPTRFTGSELIRLHAQLTGVDDAESKVPFAERLSQWLSWTDAISLAAALNGSSPATATSGARAFASAEESECERLRSALVNAFAEDGAFVADQGRGNLQPPARGATMDTTGDFSPYRRRCLAKQQAMEASISALRGRLRATLVARSSDMARPAAVDAVMEQVLGDRAQLLDRARIARRALQALAPGRSRGAGRHAGAGRAQGGLPRRVAGRVPQRHAKRVARRTGHSIATG